MASACLLAMLLNSHPLEGLGLSSIILFSQFFQCPMRNHSSLSTMRLSSDALPALYFCRVSPAFAISSGPITCAPAASSVGLPLVACRLVPVIGSGCCVPRPFSIPAPAGVAIPPRSSGYNVFLGSGYRCSSSCKSSCSFMQLFLSAHTHSNRKTEKKALSTAASFFPV